MPRKSVEEQIEELALAVGRGFEHMTNLFNQKIDQKIDELRVNMETKINVLDVKIDRLREDMNVGFSLVDKRFYAIEERLERLETVFCM